MIASETIIEAALHWGPLGAWVAWSIYREKQTAAAFQREREEWARERVKWLSTLGRKLTDRTILETTDSDRGPDVWEK